MSAKMLGKRPDVPIDLTGTAPHHPLAHMQRPATAFQPHTGAKRLVVKNLRAVPAPAASAHAAAAAAAPVAQGYYARARNDLDSALTDIFRGRQPIVSLNTLFRAVEDLCRNGEAADLHARLRQRCEAHLSDTVLPRIRHDGAQGELAMLQAVLRYWKEWSAHALMIRATFSFLDRTFLLNNKELLSLNDMAIALFRRIIFPSRSKNRDNKDKGKAAERDGHRDQNVDQDMDRDASSSAAAGGGDVGAQVISGVCLLVDQDRRQDRGLEQERRNLLQAAVNMLHVFNVYGKSFEPRLLRDSDLFFAHFAEERSASRSLRDYVTDVQKLIRREESRCNEFSFDSTTKKQLLDSLHRLAVRDHRDKLLRREDVGHLIDENEIGPLRALYDLLRLCGMHSQLLGPWESHIVGTGYAIVKDAARGDEMVVRLLDMRRTLDVVVRDAFNRDDDFTRTLRSAFDMFVNDKAGGGRATSKVGEMVAKYIDILLRGGLRSLPAGLRADREDQAVAERAGVASAGDDEAELDRQLDQGLELFRFIDGKDVFEAFYKRDLARRLLLGRSASQDAERNMLGKLRNECGSQFTHNLEQMFKDQDLSRDVLHAYTQWKSGGGGDTSLVPLDLTTRVLSQAAWPTYPDEPAVVLPPGVSQHLSDFEAHYRSRNAGRRLTWKHSLSHCVVRATFPRAGVRELVLSAHQAAVLVLFNHVEDGRPITVPEIEKLTSLTGDLLTRTLQSLACGKVRVLSKAPKGRDVARTDTFVVNKTFNEPKFRIKINTIQLKETPEENKQTHERVAADRQFETQAAIVRIMKSRKTMPHAELVAEVIEQTRRRGALDPAEIKANLEKLIDKDYLEREDNQYTYLA